MINFATSAILAASAAAVSLGSADNHNYYAQSIANTIVSNRLTRPDDNCCAISASRFDDEHIICLDQPGLGHQSARELHMPKFSFGGSVICGAHVDATLCPNGYQKDAVVGQAALRLRCTGDDEAGISVSANEMLGDLLGEKISSIILSSHPWDAKSPVYIGLSRQDKFKILDRKINENHELGATNDQSSFFGSNQNGVFDEWGDELECR